MTKWYLQIDPIYWLTNSYKAMKKFDNYQSEFCKSIINYRLQKLATLNLDQQNEIYCEKDSFENTQLSVIDRFLLSNELDSKEVINEALTIFTAVSNVFNILFFYSMITSMILIHNKRTLRNLSKIPRICTSLEDGRDALIGEFK